MPDTKDNIRLPCFASKLSQAIKTCIEDIHSDNQTIQKDVRLVRSTIPRLQLTVDALNTTKDLERHEMIMQWLSPTDFPALQNDIISQKQEGTGQWFLNSPEFGEWLQGHSKTLFCPGIPGAGKTMMAASVIDYLRKLMLTDNAGLAYVFCMYKAQIDQSARGLLSALLKQLVQSRPDIAALATNLYSMHSKPGSRPQLDEISDALLSICSQYPKVYIVVDALDEYSDEGRARSDFVRNLLSLPPKADIRILFTSRFIPEVTQDFQSTPTLEVRANDEDVRRFVAGQVPHLPKCVQRDDELKKIVLDKIVEAVDGM